MTRRPAAAVAAALTSALLLAGCGTQDTLVGLRPAPPEKSVSAPLDDDRCGRDRRPPAHRRRRTRRG